MVDITIYNTLTKQEIFNGSYARIPSLGEYIEVYVDKFNKCFMFQVIDIVLLIGGDIKVYVDANNRFE